MNTIKLPKGAREVPNCPGYCATPDGRLFSRWRGGSHRRLVNVWKRQKGTLNIKRTSVSTSINGSPVYLGRVILETFVGPAPKGMECCHNDGDCTNNAANNLRWDTRKGNVADTIAHGRTLKGEKSHFAKLTDAKVNRIRQLASEGWTQPRLAKRFKVKASSISHIVNRKTWTHLPVYALPVKRTHKLTGANIREIIALRSAGHSNIEIAARFKIDPSYVWLLTRKEKPFLPQSILGHCTNKTL